MSSVPLGNADPVEGLGSTHMPEQIAERIVGHEKRRVDLMLTGFGEGVIPQRAARGLFESRAVAGAGHDALLPAASP